MVAVFYFLILGYLHFRTCYYFVYLPQKPWRQSCNRIAGLSTFLFLGYSISFWYLSLSLHFYAHYQLMIRQTRYFLSVLSDCFHQLSFLFQNKLQSYIIILKHMNILTSFLEFTRPLSQKNQEFSMTDSQMPLNKSPSPRVTNQNVSLPKNFADQIMQLQINLQQCNCDLKMIKRLNELYMIGLQFYGKNLQSQPRKREHFVKKIQSLYNNKYVIKIIQEDEKRNSGAQISADCSNDIETAKKHKPIQEKQELKKGVNNDMYVKRNEVKPVLYEAILKQQISKFTSQSKEVVKGMLEQTQKKQVKKQQNIQKMLKNQNENLQNRLERRAQKLSGGKLKQSIVIQNQQNNLN